MSLAVWTNFLISFVKLLVSLYHFLSFSNIFVCHKHFALYCLQILILYSQSIHPNQTSLQFHYDISAVALSFLRGKLIHAIGVCHLNFKFAVHPIPQTHTHTHTHQLLSAANSLFDIFLLFPSLLRSLNESVLFYRVYAQRAPATVGVAMLVGVLHIIFRDGKTSAQKNMMWWKRCGEKERERQWEVKSTENEILFIYIYVAWFDIRYQTVIFKNIKSYQVRKI